MNKINLLGLAYGAIILFTSGTANASLIIGPQSATTTAGAQYALEYSFDQSGLSANYISGVTDFDTFTASTTHTSNPGTDYVSSTFGSVVYDLGQSYSIDRIAFWNFGGGSGNPDVAITSFDLLGNSTFLGNYHPILGGGIADIFTFDPITAQTFQIDVLSSGTTWFGIGEVAFGTVAPIPEPTTLVMMGMGLAGIGFVRGRRKPLSA